jgi:hypothetical protein
VPSDDPIALLERELVEAAQRRARGGKERSAGRLGGGLLTAAIVSIAIIIAAGGLILPGGHRRASGPAAGNVPGRHALVDELGVLRRPQTLGDLHSPAIADLLATVNPAHQPWSRFGSPDLPLIRRAGVAPWGEAVFLVPVRPVAGRSQEGLLVMVGHRGFLDCCATAVDLARWGEVQNAGRSGRGSQTARFFAVVPDGITKVELGRVVMRVHHNVAAAEANPGLVGATPVIYWFGSDGHVIRRIGDLVGDYRSVALSPPGAETALSRAAERDPSTPNTLWVTPRVAGPQAAFTVHFRVLLNAADYMYSISGAGCRLPWGTRGSPDDSRGQIWSDRVEPLAGQHWCAGTYTMSVSVAALGPYGRLARRARPFGTATFVVR